MPSGSKKPKRDSKGDAEREQNKAGESGLDPNERATLKALLEYEARIAPRIGDRKRIFKPGAHAGEAPAAPKDDSSATDFINKIVRERQRVRVRFAIRLPKTIIERIAATNAHALELRQDRGKVSLSLYKEEAEKPGKMERFETIPVRVVPIGPPSEPGARRPDPILDIADDKGELALRVPRRDVSARLIAKSALNQGEAQRRLALLKSYVKDAEQPVGSLAPTTSARPRRKTTGQGAG